MKSLTQSVGAAVPESECLVGDDCEPTPEVRSPEVRSPKDRSPKDLLPDDEAFVGAGRPGLLRPLEADALRIGEGYLFATSPVESGLSSYWGVVDRVIGGRVLLESLSRDMLGFAIQVELPAACRFYRPMRRCELRDFFYNLAWWEAMRPR